MDSKNNININVIIPIHKFDENDKTLLNTSIKSVLENSKNYKHGELPITIVTVPNINKDLEKYIKEEFKGYNINIIVNDSEKTDFCSNVNFAANNINEELFSILEYDDEYIKNWFQMFSPYYINDPTISVFLPINITYEDNSNIYQFGNEIACSAMFSGDIGFIEHESLMDYYSFNTTGGIYNRNDFNTIGGFKSSMGIAANYEFFLRLTNNKNDLKAYVVPKEGYRHILLREGSLSHSYSNMSDSELETWFELAKKECIFNWDRGKTPKPSKKKKLK